MDNTEFIASNGAAIKIQMADFRTTMALKAAISDALLEQGLDHNLKLGLGTDIKNISIDTFIKPLLSVDSNLKVYKCIFECLKRCTYNSVKITEDTFEDHEARSVYYEIVIAVVKENLLPFFQPLILKSKDLFAKMNQSQKSQSEQI